MKIQNILILAGGDGTRFWPLREKIVTNFLGKPYLLHIIESLYSTVQKLYIVVSKENKEKIKQIIPQSVHIIVQESSDGMGAAVLSCKNKIIGETLILGNDMFDYSVLHNLVKREKDLVLLAKRVDSYFPGGYLRLKGDQIEAIEEKPAPQKTPSNLVRLVADYVKDITMLIDAIDDTHSLGDIAYEQALTSIIQKNKAAYHEYDGYWYTLKYPWYVLAMMRHFLQTIKKEHVGKKASISKHALINGPVYIGDNVKIGDFTKIVGPTYIGNNVIIGDYALVRESHIGDGALIGGGSEIARSYIGEKVMLHRNYVGDSVLDQGVLMGSGAVTANFRFDEKTIQSKVGDKKVDTNLQKFGAVIGKGAKIGVNSTIFPGVKIGSNTFVGPGEVIQSDLDSNQFLMNGVVEKNKL